MNSREEIKANYEFFSLMRDPDWQKLGVCWPEFDIPDAWLPILETIADLAPGYVKAIQVKEKYGTMRVYVKGRVDDTTSFDKTIDTLTHLVKFL